MLCDCLCLGADRGTRGWSRATVDPGIFKDLGDDGVLN